MGGWLEVVLLDLISFPLGVGIGFLGSLTGIGGGFLLMPLLLILFPDKSPGALSSATMTVVFFNALSGSLPSAFQDRIRYRTGLTYALISLPMVIFGALIQDRFSVSGFRLAFGVFLVLAAALLFFKPAGDSSGSLKEAPFRFWVGAAISFAIGFVSSLFGVGGGFLFVPLFVYFLGYPTRVATATSQFILAFAAAAVIGINLWKGDFTVEPLLLLVLVVGVVIGALLGTLVGGRAKSDWILKILAVLLVFVGARMIFF